MKKLNKKQKLIIFISIITIVIIIGIVVGANVIKVAILNREYNSANNSSSNKNLIPEYIKEGITLGGVTGTLVDLNTSDATAKAEDITYGKIAYARGERIVGTRIDSKTNLNLNDVYYADVEGDGIVDGVIFADLAFGKSGQWRKSVI